MENNNEVTLGDLQEMSELEENQVETVIVEEEIKEKPIVEEPVVIDPVKEEDKKTEFIEEQSEKLFEKMEKMQLHGLDKKKRIRATEEELSEVFGDKGIIPIDDQLGFKTKSKSYREALQEVVSAYTVGKPMTGEISSVTPLKMGSTNVLVANVWHGPVKIMIPLPFLTHLTGNTGSNSNLPADKLASTIINERIGEEVDFVIKEVDEKNLVAMASRLEAMEIRRRMAFLRKRGNRYLLHEGDIVEARVCYATKRVLCVEVFGIEKTLLVQDVTYRHINNIADHYAPGDRIAVKLLSIKREKKTLPDGTEGIKIDIEISAREAEDDPREMYLRHINKNDTLKGVVTAITNANIYVQLNGMDMDMACGIPKEFDTPMVGDRVIVGVNSKSKTNIYGYIKRIL